MNMNVMKSGKRGRGSEKGREAKVIGQRLKVMGKGKRRNITFTMLEGNGKGKGKSAGKKKGMEMRMGMGRAKNTISKTEGNLLSLVKVSFAERKVLGGEKKKNEYEKIYGDNSCGDYGRFGFRSGDACDG